MFQLEVISGNQAGRTFSASHFPVKIGRSPSSDLSLQEPGLKEIHCEIAFERERGLVAHASSGARMVANGGEADEFVLHNGDMLRLGPLDIRFVVTPARQRGLWRRELFVWLVLILTAAFELLILLWLPH
jgi:hypothetical protein